MIIALTVLNKSAQITLYVVVAFGYTVALPEVSPPVERFVPVHDLALVDDHVKFTGWPPVIIELGTAEMRAFRRV